MEDSMEVLKKLEKMYDELSKEYSELDEELKNMEGTDEYDEFLAVEAASERQEKNPKLFEMSEKHRKIEDRMEIVEKRIKEEMQNVYNVYTESIKKLEAKIEANTKYLEGLKGRISELENKIKDLIESEEYKNDDPIVTLQVKELQAELKAKKELMQEINELTEKAKEDIENCKQKKEQLAQKAYDDYKLELVDGPLAEKQVESKGKAKQEQPKKESKEKQNNNVVYGGTTEKDSEEKAKTEEKEPEKEVTANEFKELYKRAKKKKLTQQDYETLSKLMSDPKNYDKYNITTGVIFNKSKALITAMAEYTFRTSGITAKEVRESFDISANKIVSEDPTLIKRSEILDWQTIKEMVINPNSKVGTIEAFKQVLELDRENLTPEKQAIYDKAKANITNFEMYKDALKVYGEVVEQRQRQRGKNSKTKESKALPASVTPGNKLNDLSGMVEKEPTDVKPLNREQAHDEPTK